MPIRIFGQAPGAFFVLAVLTALQNHIRNVRKKAGRSYEKIGSGCSEDCMNCKDRKGCTKSFYKAEEAHGDDGRSAKAGTEPASKGKVALTKPVYLEEDK